MSKVTLLVHAQYTANSRDSIRIQLSLDSSSEVLEVISTIPALVLHWSHKAKSEVFLKEKTVAKLNILCFCSNLDKCQSPVQQATNSS